MIARIWSGAMRREDGDAHAGCAAAPENERYLIERDVKVEHCDVAEPVGP